MILYPSITEFDLPSNDFILVCNGYDYNINKSVFSNYSSRFLKLTKSLTTQILHVNVQCAQSTFSSFVDACQKRPFLVNIENLPELINLCDEWEAPSIKQYLNFFSQKITAMSNEKIDNSYELRELREQVKHLHLVIEKMQLNIDELRNSYDRREEKQQIFEKQISDLQNKNKSPPVASSHPKIINFTGQPLRGLIFWLHQQITSHYSTLQDSGLLSITTSSTSHLFSSSPYKLFEDSPTCKWFSENRKNQWLKIDFIDRVIELSGYTFRVCIGSTNFWFLRNWKIEGSTDDITWKVIDEQRMNTALGNDSSMCTWTCLPLGPFRYIKITQTGPNESGDHILMLNSIEFFGKIEQRPAVLF